VAYAVQRFAIATPSLPSATPGVAYGPVTLEATGVGVSASGYATTLKWAKGSVVAPARALPAGLTLSSSGVLSGTPSRLLKSGTRSVTVKVTETVTSLNSRGKARQTKTTVKATLPLTIT
jgi:hypothetical protein